MIQKMFLLAIAACLLVIAPLLADELQNRRIANNRAGDHVGDEVEDTHRDQDHDQHNDHDERDADEELLTEHHRHSDEEVDSGEHHELDRHDDRHEFDDKVSRKNLAEFERAILQLRHEESLLQRHNPRDPEIDHVRSTIAMLERSVEMHEHEREDGHEHGDHEHDDHEHDDHEHGERDIDPRERIEHLHIAAKHLSIAGLDEEAEHVFRRAEEMERDLFGHDNERINEALGDLMEQIRDLRNEVRSLRNEIREKR